MDLPRASWHLRPLPRLHPARLQLSGIGFVPGKRERVRQRTFPHCAFSFIVAGGGDFQLGGRTWPVHAPCVFIQRPGPVFDYGPRGEWDEIYLIFDADQTAELERAGYLRQDRPLWLIADQRPVLRLFGELLELLAECDRRGNADRIDRRVEELLLVSLLDARPPGEPVAAETAVRAVAAELDSRWREDLDADVLAQRRGLPRATFRRWWRRLLGEPPARQVARRRIAEACRLLAESELPVAAVAAAVGFADPLYFSRRFRAETGTTASDYRKAHRQRLIESYLPAEG